MFYLSVSHHSEMVSLGLDVLDQALVSILATGSEAWPKEAVVTALSRAPLIYTRVSFMRTFIGMMLKVYPFIIPMLISLSH